MEQRAVMSDRLIDAQVIAACQQGDRDAFRVLFEAYKDKVYSIAVYSVGGDKAVAEDITQQVFLKLFSVISQFRGNSEFTTWLYRLVVNQCLDERRKHNRLMPLGDSEVMARPADKKPEAQYAQSELAEAVRKAIGELKPKFRMPVLLKYLEGLSYDEIAIAMGCSKGTVASRLNRAHAELARRLGHLRSNADWND
jgi:RNA polymerase sigma-70 factor, ECF subfamily